MAVLEPRSVALKPRRLGWSWLLFLHDGTDTAYMRGWRPTRNGAERQAWRAYAVAERRWRRLQGGAK